MKKRTLKEDDELLKIIRKNPTYFKRVSSPSVYLTLKSAQINNFDLSIVKDDSLLRFLLNCPIYHVYKTRSSYSKIEGDDIFIPYYEDNIDLLLKKFYTLEETETYLRNYVNSLTQEILCEFINADHRLIYYVDNPSRDLLDLALKKNGVSVFYNKCYTYDDYYKALSKCGLLLKYIKNQNEAMCLRAVRQNGDALEYVNKQTHKIILAAVTQNGTSLRYANFHTHEIELAAVKQTIHARKYVNELTEDIMIALVDQNGLLLDYFDNPSKNVIIHAINQNPNVTKLCKVSVNRKEISTNKSNYCSFKCQLV